MLISSGLYVCIVICGEIFQSAIQTIQSVQLVKIRKLYLNTEINFSRQRCSLNTMTIYDLQNREVFSIFLQIYGEEENHKYIKFNNSLNVNMNQTDPQ